MLQLEQKQLEVKVEEFSADVEGKGWGGGHRRCCGVIMRRWRVGVDLRFSVERRSGQG